MKSGFQYVQKPMNSRMISLGDLPNILHNQEQTLAGINQRLNSLNDNILGTSPKEVTKDKTDGTLAPSQGLLKDIQIYVGQTDRLLLEISSKVDSIGRCLYNREHPIHDDAARSSDTDADFGS